MEGGSAEPGVNGKHGFKTSRGKEEAAGLMVTPEGGNGKDGRSGRRKSARGKKQRRRDAGNHHGSGTILLKAFRGAQSDASTYQTKRLNYVRSAEKGLRHQKSRGRSWLGIDTKSAPLKQAVAQTQRGRAKSMGTNT